MSCLLRFTILKSCSRYNFTTALREQSSTEPFTLSSCLVAFRFLLLRVICNSPLGNYHEICVIDAIAKPRSYGVHSIIRKFEIPDFRDQSAYDMCGLWRKCCRDITIMEFNIFILMVCVRSTCTANLLCRVHQLQHDIRHRIWAMSKVNGRLLCCGIHLGCLSSANSRSPLRFQQEVPMRFA